MFSDNVMYVLNKCNLCNQYLSIYKFNVIVNTFL